MAPERTVSAIVATYNRAHFLSQALDSLLKQTRPPDQIIVIDDGSTDTTAALLDDYKARLTVIRTANSGKPAAVNTALEETNGDYVWIFDDDDVALPDALARHLSYLETHPDIDFTYSDKYRLSGSADIWARDHWQLERMKSVAPEAFLMRTMLSMNTLMQGMLIPRHALITIGRFDETLDRCEDHDMIMRLAAAYRGANLGDPTFVYREHAGTRGAGHRSHTAHDRFRVMAGYRRQVFRKARNEFALPCYLKHKSTDAIATSEGGLRAAALAQRGCIMLRHGLVDEAIADLDAALTDPAIDDVHQPWLTDIFSHALDAEPWIFDDRRRLIRGVTQVLSQRNRLPLGLNFLRGIYWHMRRAAKKRDTRQALQAGVFITTFGVAWLRAMLRGRLGIGRA